MTLAALQVVTNGIREYLSFTGETSMESTGNTVLCLDTQLLTEQCDTENEWFTHKTKSNEEVPGTTDCCHLGSHRGIYKEPEGIFHLSEKEVHEIGGSQQVVPRLW